MKIKQYILLAATILVVLASLSFAQSQPPPPGPLKGGEKEQDRPAQKKIMSSKNQRGTDDLPLVVKVVETQSTDSKKSDDRKNIDQSPSIDWRFKITDILLIIFNALLALFTFRLWRSTHKMWKATKDVAEAAKQSAGALPKIERAYIFVEIEIKEDEIKRGGDGQDYSWISVKIKNHGNTPAILTELRLLAWIGEIGKVAKLIETHKSEIPSGIVIGSSKHRTERVPIRISSEKWGDVENMTSKFYCFGRVRYKDVLDQDRETGFCWEFNTHEDFRRFGISNNKDLNYYT